MLAHKMKKIGEKDSFYLDLFRGVSSQLVLVGHMLMTYKIIDVYYLPKVQNLGVLIFFILSGFLISQTTFIKSSLYGLKNYLIDRFSRIYFSFLPALFFVLVIDVFIRSSGYEYNKNYDFSLNSFIGNLFMLQSHPLAMRFGISSFGSARPFWTVSIEWFYYIFFGLLFFFKLKQVNVLKSILFFTLFAFSAWVVVYYLNGRGGGLTFYWLFGFILAVLYNYEYQIKNYFIGTILILVTVSLMVLRYRMQHSNEVYDVAQAILCSVLLLLLMKSNNFFNLIARNKLMTKLAIFLASYSYSLYLIHYSLIDLIKQTFHIENPGIMTILVMLVGINLIAYGFYWLFERHHTRFRKWIKKLVFPNIAS